MTYELRQMTGDEALGILAALLAELSSFPAEEMTTFELHVLRKAAENPPSRRRGLEERMVEPWEYE